MSIPFLARDFPWGYDFYVFATCANQICIIGYIGEFEEVDDHRNGKIVIQLNGRYVFLLPI